MSAVDILLVGGSVITMNAQREVIHAGAVAVRGDSIVAVGSAESLRQTYTAQETIDCTGRAVLPGLVNAHTHVPMVLLRGLNDDLRLDVWLGYLMPVEREFVTPAFVRLGARIACAEMIRSGITTFADMYYFESDIAAETAAIGMRALLGQTILVFPAPDAESYEDAIDLCRHFIEAWNGHPLIQPAVSPHAWYTATPELLRACADLARAYDVPIHTHISETELEVHNCREQHQMPVVPWTAKNGLLDAKLLAAHCVHIDHGEMLRLKKAGAGVAHCPTSNLKLASGIAKVAEMREVGLNVGLGTDGAASNNDLDMLEEMRLAALLGKVCRNDPTDLPARDAVEIATIGGAKALHLGHLTGSLEVGKRADLIVVDLAGVHNWPHFDNRPDNIYSQLVYAAKSSDVVNVMCNGRWLMRDRQLLTIDEAAAQAEAAQIAAAIDAFVLQRESSPYRKLITLEGAQRQESYEVQVKVALADPAPILAVLNGNQLEIVKSNTYRQYDQYFIFSGEDPDAARLRFREDDYMDANGEVSQVRTRLTLLGVERHQEFPNAVMLSRSRWLAPATRTLRFYREYFAPPTEVEVHKIRRRWRILYESTDVAINLDQVTQPALPGYFLELKARTWSRTDAERKANLLSRLMEVLGVDKKAVERRDYPEMAAEQQEMIDA